jgi:hypothetical protein
VNELRDVLRSAVAAPQKCSLLAGGTDLLVHLHASPDLSPDLINLSDVKELKSIEIHRDHMEIGACATFADIEGHPLIQERFSALARAASLVGSPQIRNLGTIGGNIANASPAADSLPPLCALEASRAARVGPRKELASYGPVYPLRPSSASGELTLLLRQNRQPEGRRYLETQPCTRFLFRAGACPSFRRVSGNFPDTHGSDGSRT